jgi:uncharacterized MAPEG superfamily protein
MFFAYWMILAAAFLPYVATVYSKRGDVDNHAPRQYATTLTGARRRADWAQQNGFESFPAFAAAVVVAGIAGAAHPVMNWLTGTYIALRIIYTFAYISDRATLRSIVFSLSAACVLGLFVAAGLA